MCLVGCETLLTHAVTILLLFWIKLCIILFFVICYSWFGPHWNPDSLLHHEALQVHGCRSHCLDSDLSSRLCNWTTAGIPCRVCVIYNQHCLFVGILDYCFITVATFLSFVCSVVHDQLASFFWCTFCNTA